MIHLSTLKDFVHHELDAMPGPAPKPPVSPAAPENGSGAPAAASGAASPGAASPGAKAAKAVAEGALKGALYYTQVEAHACREGWVESDETVKSKLRSKEEFPQG